MMMIMTSTRDAVREAFYGTASDFLSDRAVVSPSAQLELGATYMAMPEVDEYDPRVFPAWHHFAHETMEQWERLEAMGFTMTVMGSDPYGAPGEMFSDVDENRHIAVLSTATTGGHPFLSDDANDTFRAVHDVLGHYASGRGFDRHGEEAAYRRHCQTYGPTARLAMATETRGQNAALIRMGEFQSERLAILPDEWRDAYALTPRSPAEWATTHAQQEREGWIR